MYYVMRASAPSLHRESTDSLIRTWMYILGNIVFLYLVCLSVCNVVYYATHNGFISRPMPCFPFQVLNKIWNRNVCPMF